MVQPGIVVFVLFEPGAHGGTRVLHYPLPRIVGTISLQALPLLQELQYWHCISSEGCVNCCHSTLGQPTWELVDIYCI